MLDTVLFGAHPVVLRSMADCCCAKHRKLNWSSEWCWCDYCAVKVLVAPHRRLISFCCVMELHEPFRIQPFGSRQRGLFLF